MKPDPESGTEGESLKRRLWLATFSAGAVTLVCCLVVLLGVPYLVGDTTWFFWTAIGSGLLCTLAAVQLKSDDREEAAGEAEGLARSTRRSKHAWDDLDGADD